MTKEKMSLEDHVRNAIENAIIDGYTPEEVNAMLRQYGGATEFRQLCVWEGTSLGDNDALDFVEWCEAEFGGGRIKFEEPVTTKEGRVDLFFRIHEADIGKFAAPRLQYGMRWWEDVRASEGENSVYSAEVLARYPIKEVDCC